MNALFAPGGERPASGRLLDVLWCSDFFDLDAQAQPVIAPQARICSSSVAPVIRIRNNGALALTSLDIAYSIDGIAEGTTTWSGSLDYSATEELTLPDIAPADGNHTFGSAGQQPQRVSRPKCIQRHGLEPVFHELIGQRSDHHRWWRKLGQRNCWSLDLNGTVYASGGAGTATECIPMAVTPST